MSFTVTIMPSGHVFTAHAKESLLDAALRCGLNISYHCNSGGCGECKIRILEGEHEVVRPADYPLSEVEKLNGHALLCSIAARSDMRIEASEAREAKDIPLQDIEVKVASFKHLADNYYELNLRTPRSRTLRFLAGQKVRLTDNAGQSIELAIASCPCNGMNLQCHISDNGGNEFVRRLLAEGAQMGKIGLTGPYGDFTLQDESPRSSVFIAYDTGFAPIKSLVEHALALEREQTMYLFWLMPWQRAHYQANYCRAWEDVFDGIVFIPLNLNSERVNTEAFEAMAQRVIARAPEESEVDLYLSGPQTMISVFRRAFQARFTPERHIYSTTI